MPKFDPDRIGHFTDSGDVFERYITVKPPPKPKSKKLTEALVSWIMGDVDVDEEGEA